MMASITRLKLQSLCWFGAAVLYAGPSLAVVVWAINARTARVAMAALLAFLLVGCVFAALARTWRRFLLVQVPFAVFGLAFVCYTLAFGIPPGQTLAGVLAGTSRDEIRGFLGLAQGREFLWLLTAWSVGYLLLASGSPKRPIFSAGSAFLRRAVLAVVLIFSAASLSDPAQFIDGVALHPVIGAALFLGGDLRSALDARHGSEVHKTPYHAQRNGAEEVHVLILGESVRRDSWSAYGYARKTTPYLDSLKNEAVFFNRALAEANLTRWAVPMILTGMSAETLDLHKVRGSLFDLARESGYQTSLMMNQEPSVIATTGVDADIVETPFDLSRNINGRMTHDDAMLPAIRREIARAGKARFIGVHMMGSHWEYANRYPPSFQRFGSAQDISGLSLLSIFMPDAKRDAILVDAYDNTVLYTDWFLEQVINEASKLSVPATVTFVPDHGEDLQQLDGESGHGQPTYTSHAFRIPVFVWTNAAYRQLHPGICDSLKANSDKEIRSSNVFFSVGQMMGITWPGFNSARSFASKDFVPTPSERVSAGGVLVLASETHARRGTT